MMAKSWLVFLGGIFCAALAAAALAASYRDDSLVNDGKWNARIDGDARTARQGRVAIDNFEGQWREIGPRRAGDPCRGTKPFPITVQKSSTKLATQYRELHELTLKLHEQLKASAEDAKQLPKVPELDTKLLEEVEQTGTNGKK